MTARRRLFTFLVLVSIAAPQQLRASSTDQWSQLRAAGIEAAGKKDYANAEKQFQDAVNVTATFKKSDPRVTTSLEDLAGLYARRKKFADARTTYLKILKNKESLYGKDNPILIPRLNDVIKVTCAGGLCYNTIPELKRLLLIRQKAFGANSTDVPITLQVIGEAYEKHNDYAEALKYFRQAVSVQKNISGANSVMVTALNKNVDRILNKQSSMLQ
jgi:tetratricopeptide (TPR) repeat protein